MLKHIKSLILYECKQTLDCLIAAQALALQAKPAPDKPRYWHWA